MESHLAQLITKVQIHRGSKHKKLSLQNKQVFHAKAVNKTIKIRFLFQKMLNYLEYHNQCTSD